jgi:hypothetical protein
MLYKENERLNRKVIAMHRIFHHSTKTLPDADRSRRSSPCRFRRKGVCRTRSLCSLGCRSGVRKRISFEGYEEDLKQEHNQYRFVLEHTMSRSVPCKHRNRRCSTTPTGCVQRILQ